MQNATKISPTNFRVTSVLGTKREGDEMARGRNDRGTTWQGDKTARGQNNHKAHDLVRSSEQAGLILARDSQRSVESIGFSSGTLVSFHRES